MRFVDTPKAEELKCLIYDILSKQGTLRFIKIYGHILVSVKDDDYEAQSTYNIQRVINEMENLGLIESSLNFEYSVKPVIIEKISNTLDISDCFLDGNIGGFTNLGIEKI